MMEKMDVKKMNVEMEEKKGEGKMMEKKKFERKFMCNCCGNYTLKRKGENDICEVCFWIDVENNSDLWDKNNNVNGISLNKARQNYKDFGACLFKYRMVVRAPSNLEVPRRKKHE